jgi:hypothetical protein
MQKFVTFEKTFTRREIEAALLKQMEIELQESDVDFKEARWMQHDVTIRVNDEKEVTAEMVLILDDVKLRKK